MCQDRVSKSRILSPKEDHENSPWQAPRRSHTLFYEPSGCDLLFRIGGRAPERDPTSLLLLLTKRCSEPPSSLLDQPCSTEQAEKGSRNLTSNHGGPCSYRPGCAALHLPPRLSSPPPEVTQLLIAHDTHRALCCPRTWTLALSCLECPIESYRFRSNSKVTSVEAFLDHLVTLSHHPALFSL